jgi:hypothetical protein
VIIIGALAGHGLTQDGQTLCGANAEELRGIDGDNAIFCEECLRRFASGLVPLPAVLDGHVVDAVSYDERRQGILVERACGPVLYQNERTWALQSDPAGRPRVDGVRCATCLLSYAMFIQHLEKNGD